MWHKKHNLFVITALVLTLFIFVACSKSSDIRNKNDMTNNTTEPTDQMTDNTEEEAKKELDTLKCELVQKSTIAFDTKTQPIFFPLSDNGINNLNKLKLKFPELIKEQIDSKKGIYKAYICKFNDSDSRTYVVNEADNGNKWIMSVYFDDSGIVSIDKIYDVTDDIRKYKAEQIKKVSYDVEEITMN